MRGIISMLWHRQAAKAMEPHVRDNPSVIYTRPGFAGTVEPVASQIRGLGSSVVLLESLLSPGVIAGLQAQAATRARRIRDDLTDAAIAAAFPEMDYEPAKIRDALTKQLTKRLYDALATAESIVLANERTMIDLVVVNNDAEQAERVAIAWARAHNVPTLHLVHSIGSLHARPAVRVFHADVMAIAAQKCVYYYDGMDLGPERFVLTGWPVYDEFAMMLENRSAARSAFRRSHAIDETELVVMFATTWFGGFSALEYLDIFAESARRVFAAIREVRERLPNVRFLVKDRSVNARFRDVLDAIGAEHGFAPSEWLYIDGDPMPVLIAVDAVVCLNSSIATEVAAVQIPVISMWSPTSWLGGPAYCGEDGVIEALPGDSLADLLVQVLTNPEPAVRDLIDGRLTTEGIVHDGQGAQRFAKLMTDLRQTFKPTTAHESARTVSRPDVGDRRPDVLEFIGDANCILDLRCGDGRRARALRERLPTAKLIGIDPDPKLVEAARRWFDVAVVGNGSSDDLESLRLAHASIDVVLLLGVLNRLVDPSAMLRRLRQYLTATARVIACVDNARSLGACVRLADGSELEGPGGAYAYDAIHHFSLASATALLNSCDFAITRAHGVPDPFATLPPPPYHQESTFSIGRLGFNRLAPQDMAEMRLHELILVAQPRQ